MRVRRSLTIKQMATVSGVALVTFCIFIIIQLFHLVQQQRVDYSQQMESIADSVHKPLAQAVLRMDMPETQNLLNTLPPIGILSRADIVLPNQFQVQHADFTAQRPVPALVMRIFDLPIQVSMPLYSSEPITANSQPLAYLVLQVDSYRMYQFILSTLSMMLSTYLLLTLILSVAITWCINRLLVHPLRAMVRELENVPQEALLYHQLMLPAQHHDDELGALVRNYNRNQQAMVKAHLASSRNAMTSGLDSLLLTAPFEQRRFALFLQSQWDMQTQQVIAAEVFPYWLQDDTAILPAALLPLVEGRGMIVPIGNWMLAESCRILANWQAKDIALPLAVKVSALQLQQPEFVPLLKQQLTKCSINPGKLWLEITATACNNDVDATQAQLSSLRELGVGVVLVVIDATNVSSLKHLPWDSIKIAAEVIAGVPEYQAMTQTVSRVAAEFHQPMMAEGVATGAQREWLLQQGIRRGQGPLFGQLLPKEEFEQRFFSVKKL
ncbi:EAL domain-containing protein [Serratia sp. DD3]|uniref:EAL domain-containing protein n=1 Tax=Serratia sp. DD3 TaxID=1410619 RepID=UPI0003C4E5BE|nr:EAL domain-containing protein [Serratia sp. DD3]KEY60458.1 putative membrane protein YjcC [Serratia sp. DD3]